jgi:hypothetical protein
MKHLLLLLAAFGSCVDASTKGEKTGIALQKDLANQIKAHHEGRLTMAEILAEGMN